MIYPLLPVFLTATLGATPLVVGLIEGAADGLSSILKYVSGSASDRMTRRKPLVMAGYALAAASRALIGVATAWTSILVARLVDRTGKGIRSAPRDALIADVTEPENRGRAFGFHRALDHTGAVIGPLIAIALLQSFSMRQVFLLAVIPGAVGVVLLLFLRERSGAPPFPAATHAGQDTRAPMTPRFRHVMVAVGLFALANSSDAFLILQAHHAGVSAAMLPLLWAAHHVVKAIFSTHAGALSDRVGRRRLLVIGWGLYGVIYLLFPLAGSLAAFLALFLVYAIPFTLTDGAERALVGDVTPAQSRGRGFGIYYLTNGLGVLAGSVIFGLLSQSVSPLAAFTTGAVLAFAAATTIMLFKE